MLKRMILCSVWYVFISQSVFAQNATITGKVIDEDTKGEISQVSLEVNNETILEITNKIGEFSINSKKFPIKLTFLLLGYHQKMIIVKKATSNLNIILEREATQLSEIVISSKKQETLDLQEISKISLQLRPIKFQLKHISTILLDALKGDNKIPSVLRFSST